MIDWDAVEEMQEKAVEDLKEMTTFLRLPQPTGLTEEKARYFAARGQLALAILSMNRPMPNPFMPSFGEAEHNLVHPEEGDEQ